MLRSFIRASIRNLKQQLQQQQQQQQRCLEGTHLSAYYSSSRKGGRGLGEASIRQHRLASEVKTIVSAALQQGPYDSALLQRCGFEIEEVAIPIPYPPAQFLDRKNLLSRFKHINDDVEILAPNTSRILQLHIP